MDLIKAGRALLYSYKCLNTGVCSLLHVKQDYTEIQKRTFAARKGYREMAKKKKIKVVIEKKGWIPHNLRESKTEEIRTSRRSKEEKKSKSIDDVWLARCHSWRVFDFKEAVQSHQETHHPTVYNVPDALVNLTIELNMSTAKPTKFVEKFNRMAMLPNVFQQEGLKERSILVFCKTDEQKEAARNAGAGLVGGVEIIKEIERGRIVLPDFRFVIAHPTILPEMVTIRGLLKKKFPTVQLGTLGPNVGELVTQFKNGVEYSCLRDEKELDYGWIDTSIGRLNMDVTKIEENFKALLDNINKQRPKRPGPFITRVIMSSPPSVERLKINLEPFIQDEEAESGESSDEDEPVKATA